MIWYKSVNTGYSVIFSYAIHHWLDVSSKEYAAMINRLLNPRGYLCFESHDYKTDFMFYEICEEFKSLEYIIIRKRQIKEAGQSEREFVLFQKMR